MHPTPPPPFCKAGLGFGWVDWWELILLSNFQKGGTESISVFRGGLLGKRGWIFLGGGVYKRRCVSIKIKNLNSEM